MIVGTIKHVGQKCCFSFRENSSVFAVVMRLRHMHFSAHPPDCWHPCRIRGPVYFQRQDLQSRRQLASPSEPLRTHVLHALRLHGGPCSTPGPNVYIALKFSGEVCLQSVWSTLFCLQKGHVKCNTIKCPALSCENPVAEPQQCCPKCTGLIIIQTLR